MTSPSPLSRISAALLLTKFTTYPKRAMAAPAPAGRIPGGPAAPPGGGRPSATSYETYAPRSAPQRHRLARLAALTAGPAAPPNAGGGGDDGGAAADRPSLMGAMSPPAPPPVAADGAEGPAAAAAALAGTHLAADHLAAVVGRSTRLRLALRATVDIAEDLSNRHADLLRKSGELSAAAERLQSEEAALSRHAREIGMPLRHYDAVDRIGVLVGVLFKDGGRTVVRGLARIKVDGDDFPSVLDEIDAAVAYFGDQGGREALAAHEQKSGRSGRGADADLASGTVQYYRRALSLQEAALYLVREAVADRISQTTKDVEAALNLRKEPLAADKLEASLVYTRFHGISSRSNHLLSLVTERADRAQTEQYQDLLGLCRNAYCGSREALLRLTVRSHMDKLRAKHGLIGMTRLASVFLIRLCTVETALYLDFFGGRQRMEEKQKRKGQKEEAANGEGAEGERKREADPQGGNGGKPGAGGERAQQEETLASQVMSKEGAYYDTEFQASLSTLCSSLHRTVRRGLVNISDLDTLCQIVAVLREERSLASSSPTTMAAAHAISSVIVDAQERLIFCANSSLTKDVVRFKATPADLDYPERLMPGYQKPAAAADGNGDGKGEGAESESNENDAVRAQLQVYESWFPPMRSVLRVLSKIFRVVEPRVFEDIALSSVQACTGSLKEGSAYILNKSGVVHADLFLVKHLLILREQLSPFDIQLRSVERQLDFSDAGKAVSRFLANQNRRLFSMSNENALMTLLREGVSVQEASVDSKRDLDDALRSACNDFIEHTSTSLAGPLLGLVEQYKAASSSSSSDNLLSLPFLSADSIKAVLEETNENLNSKLDEVTSQMVLYLESSATQGILLKPAVRKITRAVDESRKVIGSLVDGSNGWDAEVRQEINGMLVSVEAIVKTGSSKRLVR